MKIKEITENIFYAGVNDRTTTRFEALWPLPYGVSYNSYVVADEKTALIDTVAEADALLLIDNIKALTGNGSINYLVVNHMEPDHSGSLPIIANAFPEIKIIGNRQTISMIKGYYGISDNERFIEVKDGDEISLGTKTLKFFLTPMVHWPETMMTYCVEKRMLFSGDAFGTFGALNGGIVDFETDVDPYMEEMYRYYSNIVGKYGSFVQKALAKLKDLPLNFICPTHGPVWHDNISGVVTLTDRLSRYEAEEGVTIVYGSMYGHNAVVADRIADALAARGVKKIRIHDASYSDMSHIISDAFRYKGLIVGSPTYSMNLFPPIAQFLDAMRTREIRNKAFASFGGHTWASATEKHFQAFAEQRSLQYVGHVEIRQAPDAETDKAIETLAEKFISALDLICAPS